MKLNFYSLATVFVLPALMSAQDSIAVTKKAVSSENYPNEYKTNPTNLPPTLNKTKKFNDWAISAGGGTAIMKSGSLYSLHDESGSKNLFGWSSYFSIDKAISHTFGLKLQYDKGETRQGWVNTKDHVASKSPGGRTQYDAISILGDVNVSNLFKRIDNKSPYRWALHAYAGAGSIAYKSYLQKPGSYNQSLTKEVKPFKLNSLYAQLGTGLKYRLTNSLDLEGRVMYLMTGGKGFDGARDNYVDPARSGKNDMMNASLGITYNIGKHKTNLFWFDPLQEIYYKLEALENRNQDIVVCKSGDADNDGVCDDWDRELNTPEGARVDGAGRALDTDLDGVIDLYDKCVTVPGPVENDGCPIIDKKEVAKDIERKLKNVFFDFNKSTINSSSTPTLYEIANIIKNQGGNYLIVGHTDSKGNPLYNLKLSKERAASVVKSLELVGGVPSNVLKSKGVGSSFATVPPTASNSERALDRKVTVTFIDNAEWNSIPKKDYNDLDFNKKSSKKKVKSTKKKK